MKPFNMMFSTKSGNWEILGRSKLLTLHFKKYVEQYCNSDKSKQNPTFRLCHDLKHLNVAFVSETKHGTITELGRKLMTHVTRRIKCLYRNEKHCRVYLLDLIIFPIVFNIVMVP